MRLDTHRSVIRLQSLDMLLAGLMDDLRQIAFTKQRHGLWHHFVERLGAETAANDQQAQSAIAPGKAFARRGDGDSGDSVTFCAVLTVGDGQRGAVRAVV